jgi:hypothetical protein
MPTPSPPIRIPNNRNRIMANVINPPIGRIPTALIQNDEKADNLIQNIANQPNNEIMRNRAILAVNNYIMNINVINAPIVRIPRAEDDRLHMLYEETKRLYDMH